ncbi:phenylalanine--tRNA ligase subunit alpha [Carboxydothermus ferrireducens]|uniref:phenylalanine--tRNA ligase subunit alpha n=1 Tax=Carboxydothermus ferrireducens TaxID=54265 RepID=UPI00048995D4|nr:phenylalanine--tRNA ligase subunit alpha [Carboxydothermus ferrireducens]
MNLHNEELWQKYLGEVSRVSDLNELQTVKVKFLGKKGEVTLALKNLKNLPPELRPEAGHKINTVKKLIEEDLEKREQELLQKALEEKLSKEAIDVTLPGYSLKLGKLHPLTQVQHRIVEIFTSMGFSVATGPEIEKDYYNFEALNLPKDHPARDMQDSFYITEEVLLRTHTSPVQVRVMEKYAPNLPIRIISPGKVYRRDDDATHSPMFAQCEGLAVDKNIRFSDLKGVLLTFIKELFGPKTKMRLRPSYFPFTEPSAEVDISCVICGGIGCKVCKGSGWLEILGSGMVHPRVLEMAGYDSSVVTGFAFGMGLERIAMLLYGIDDLRLFYDNDIRFLQMF